MNFRIRPGLLVLASFVCVAHACAIYDNPDEVVQEDDQQQSLSACSFLGTETGICSAGVPTESGNCLPPIGYETVEASCDGVDNDCNGETDPGCPCDYRDLSDGVCGTGTKASDGSCSQPADFEEDEMSCDGVDNDCDGVADEGCDCNFRGVMVGVCVSEIGDDGGCAVPVAFEGSEQSCDGLDNDCDGEVDEEVNGPCALSEGVCGQAVGPCVDGAIAECGAMDYGPQYEIDETSCDGLDNDCDGIADEGCGCDFEGIVNGVCGAAVISDAGDCEPPNTFQDEESECDNVDNDCDGTVDEDCTCSPGDSRPCGLAEGLCQPGEQTCGASATWGACVDAVEPVVEVCDGADNDCDGETDEQLRFDCQRQEGVCKSASVACDPDRQRGGPYRCSADELRAHNPRFEPDEVSCDQEDNDCDGVVDEGCPCQWKDTPVGACGTATIDANGNCVEPDTYEEPESLCDGIDNDCDSVTDEKCPCDFNGSSTGVCSEGKISETTGTCLAPSTYASTDASCDGLDNDCDGSADEDAPASESNCANGKDDDCDGEADCQDPDCRGKVCDTTAAQQEPMVSSLEQPVGDSKTCQVDGTCK